MCGDGRVPPCADALPCRRAELEPNAGTCTMCCHSEGNAFFKAGDYPAAIAKYTEVRCRWCATSQHHRLM